MLPFSLSEIIGGFECYQRTENLTKMFIAFQNYYFVNTLKKVFKLIIFAQLFNISVPNSNEQKQFQKYGINITVSGILSLSTVLSIFHGLVKMYNFGPTQLQIELKTYCIQYW